MTTYIYQQLDWPNFHWDLPFLTELLAEAHASRGRLIGRMEALGFSAQQETLLSSLTLDAVKSSEIEGEHLDLTQVRSSVARRLGIVLEDAIRSSRHVDGVVAMILDATQDYSKPLTAMRLWQWHLDLFSSDFRIINIAQWRDDKSGPMEVVSGPIGRERVHFRAPAAETLTDYMDLFFQYTNESNEEPLLKAAIAHLWFITIHPFEDGNGRIARALTDCLLARSEKSSQRYYSMSAQICEERTAYYDILESTQKGSMNITPWLKWFLECLIRALKKTHIIVDRILWKNTFWEQHKKDEINSRQQLMLNKLFEGFEGKLTTPKWAKIAKCSHDTALRDIQRLINLDILEQDEGGGRSTSYSLKEKLLFNRI